MRKKLARVPDQPPQKDVVAYLFSVLSFMIGFLMFPSVALSESYHITFLDNKNFNLISLQLKSQMKKDCRMLLLLLFVYIENNRKIQHCGTSNLDWDENRRVFKDHVLNISLIFMLFLCIYSYTYVFYLGLPTTDVIIYLFFKGFCFWLSSTCVSQTDFLPILLSESQLMLII